MADLKKKSEGVSEKKPSFGFVGFGIRKLGSYYLGTCKDFGDLSTLKLVNENDSGGGKEPQKLPKPVEPPLTTVFLKLCVCDLCKDILEKTLRKTKGFIRRRFGESCPIVAVTGKIDINKMVENLKSELGGHVEIVCSPIDGEEAAMGINFEREPHPNSNPHHYPHPNWDQHHIPHRRQYPDPHRRQGPDPYQCQGPYWNEYDSPYTFSSDDYPAGSCSVM